tara:strand:+ start:279 stop:1190 length:912 start_codon:yes stop_codon:yes gene_type:complete
MANTGAESMIIDGREFDATNDFMYTKPKVNQSGGKSVGILNSNTKKGLYMSTPLMLTWGINEYVDEASGKRTYDMLLQFPKDEYNTAELDNFLKNLKEFENKLKKDAIKNSKEWMNKAKMSDEVIDALWTPMLKYPKHPDTGDFDYDRPPTLRVKIPYWEGEWRTEVYDLEGNALYPNKDGVLPTELVVKGINVATVIQCGGIWFANGKFGVTWKLFQCVVKPKATMKGKCLITLSDTDKQAMQETDSEEVTDTVGVEVAEDSDEEQEEEEELAPTPPPMPVKEPETPKKKVVRKKKTVSAEA